MGHPLAQRACGRTGQGNACPFQQVLWTPGPWFLYSAPHPDPLVSYFLNLSKPLLIWDSILLDAYISLSEAELLVSLGAICWTLADSRKQE